MCRYNKSKHLQDGGQSLVLDESEALQERLRADPTAQVVEDDVQFNERFPTCAEFENLLE